jgi:hypothetical protein
MNWLQTVKNVIGGLTDLVLMLVALAIVATILVGGENLPFFGAVVSNLVALVNELGTAGLSGLIVLGIIVWLFSKRSVG